MYSDRKQVSSFLVDEEMERHRGRDHKGHKETFRSDGYSHYLDDGDDFMGGYIHQNLSNCTFQPYVTCYMLIITQKKVSYLKKNQDWALRILCFFSHCNGSGPETGSSFAGFGVFSYSQVFASHPR